MLVALPAHNEQAVITACLDSVVVALGEARQAGVIDRARVAVALHRCSDDTGARVRAFCADHADLESVIVVDNAVLPVGAVRTRLVETALGVATPFADPAWIFSTDADSVVPPDWVTATLAQALDHRADLVLGLVDLADWEVDEATRQAYERIIAAGLTPSGHDHAYAANLAIAMTAFRRTGGFPALPHGEEHGLAAACRAAGLTVTSTGSPRVQTSARMPGRASSGLGALLAALARADAEPAPRQTG